MLQLPLNPLKSNPIRPIHKLAFWSVFLFVLLLQLPPATLCYGGVEFPGPIERELLASPLWGMSVPWVDQTAQYVLVGDDEGFLNLLYHVNGESTFGIFSRYPLGGEVMWIGPWEGGPYGQRGVVAATANPDRLYFLELIYTEPFFTVQQMIELPEDPGTLDFVSPGPQGESQAVMSLPGVDQVLLLRSDSGQWGIFQTLGAGDDPWSLTAIDLDNDQVLEFVTAGRGVLSGTLGIFSQEADGTYSLQSHKQLPGKVRQVGAEDFNLDGTQELIVSYSDLAQIDIMSGETGDLIIHETIETALPMDFFQVVALLGGQWGLLSSVQDRGFMDYFRYNQGAWAHEDSYYVGCRPVMTLSSDLNGDGINDVVCLSESQNLVSILIGKSQADFWGYPAIPLPAFPGSTAVGDFDQDGYDELVVGSFGENVLSRYSFQTAGGLFSTPAHQDLGFFPSVLAVGDVLGDSSLELFALNSSAHQLQLLTQVPGGGFLAHSNIDLASNPSRMIVADMDNDGFSDLVMVHRSPKEIRILYGAGTGIFSQQVSIVFPLGVFDVVALKADEDVYLDLVVSDGLGRTWAVTNIDGRSFGSPIATDANTGAKYLSAADLDGDSDLDVVVANTVSESLTILENLGNGQWYRRVGSLGLGGQPASIQCSDMDDNGIVDFVSQMVGDGGLRVVMANAEWDYNPPLEFQTSSNVVLTQVADFNQDGPLDVLNLDSELELAVVLGNTERVLVAVDPSALTLNCTAQEFEIRILPDRSGPWELSLGKPGQWQVLASNGTASTGQIDFDGQGWVLEFSREEAGYPDDSMRLQLTIGVEGNQEILTLALENSCLTEPGHLPRLRWLDQPWPNPFNPRIQSRIQLDSATMVEVAVFDVAGRRITTLLEGQLQAGVHPISWDGMSEGQSVSAGLYFLRIRSDNALLSKKIMLLK